MIGLQPMTPAAIRSAEVGEQAMPRPWLRVTLLFLRTARSSVHRRRLPTSHTNGQRVLARTPANYGHVGASRAPLRYPTVRRATHDTKSRSITGCVLSSRPLRLLRTLDRAVRPLPILGRS